MALEFEVINTAGSLSDPLLLELNFAYMNMWADHDGGKGLGEFVQCTKCGTIHSKEDIFHEKCSTEQRIEQIMSERNVTVSSILCHDCDSPVEYMYDPSNIDLIRERLTQSIESILVIARDDTGMIVGAEEGYIDTLENIFRREFAFHYSRKALPYIRERIGGILSSVPDQFFVASSVGFVPGYRDSKNIFGLIQSFGIAIPDKYIGTPGITEINTKNNFHLLARTWSQAESLRLGDIAEERGLFMPSCNTRNTSDILVSKDPIGMAYKKFGSMKNSREFFRANAMVSK